jgi:hypothetical protein
MSLDRTTLIGGGIALVVFIAVLLKVWSADAWEENLRTLIFCFVGLIGILCAEEAEDWIGIAPLSTQKRYMCPANVIRAVGAIILLSNAKTIFFG